MIKDLQAQKDLLECRGRDFTEDSFNDWISSVMNKGNSFSYAVRETSSYLVLCCQNCSKFSQWFNKPDKKGTIQFFRTINQYHFLDKHKDVEFNS